MMMLKMKKEDEKKEDKEVSEECITIIKSQ